MIDFETFLKVDLKIIVVHVIDDVTNEMNDEVDFNEKIVFDIIIDFDVVVAFDVKAAFNVKANFINEALNDILMLLMLNKKNVDETNFFV